MGEDVVLELDVVDGVEAGTLDEDEDVDLPDEEDEIVAGSI